MAPNEARPLRVPLPTETSGLPHPSIRVSYCQPISRKQNKKKTNATKNDTIIDDCPRVQFQPNVSVVEIPSRDCYSRREKETIWRSSKEIRFMARRNRKEYSHDGGDWRTAT